MAKKKQDDNCPRCGYCKHCGRSGRWPYYPYPYPWYFNNWEYNPQYVGTISTVTYSTPINSNISTWVETDDSCQ